jgi:hypothetical protein
MKIRFVAACILAAAAFACGIGTGTGTDSGTAGSSVTGNLRGAPMAVADATSGQVTITASFGRAPVGAIILSSSGNICANAAANQEAKSSKFLIIFVGDYNSTSGASTAPTAPGTYTVYLSSSTAAPPAKFALAVYSQTDATCQPVPGTRTSATSGTVTLTSASGGSYTGTFDLTFDSGDHVTGTFTGTNCAGLQTAVDSTTTICI